MHALFASPTQNVLPNLFRRKLTYAETYAFTTGAAGVVGSTQLMSLGSIFDPNITGVGHQPYGHDQLAEWYSRYLVLAARVRLVCTTPGATAEIAVVWKYQTTQSFLTIAGMTNDRCTEAPMIGTALVGPSGIDRVMVVDIPCNIPQILGITASQYRDQYARYGALMSASPTEVATLEIGIASFTGVAGEQLSIQVVIEYDVELSEPIQLPQS